MGTGANVSQSNARQNPILLVESSPEDLECLRSCLEGAGLDLIEADGVEAALKMTKQYSPTLVLSEIALADGSGFALCRQLRDRPTTLPLSIMLVSRWSKEADRILAFECGADDFVAKPYFPRELASRVRAVMRRSEARQRTEAVPADSSSDALCIDLDRHSVLLDGRPITLTFQEFSLLSVIARRRGHAFTRKELIDRAWRNGESLNARSVDAHVKSLRRKLGEFGRAIETIRGIGYRFTENALVRQGRAEPDLAASTLGSRQPD
jgi:DNA-binding response OmpR family regulator